MISATASCGGFGELVVPALDQMAAQRGQQRILHAVVMALRDTVFAVVAAQLSEERHRLLGALGDQLGEQPRHRLGERGALRIHVRRKQVAGRDVDGEPAGVEPADQFVRTPAQGRPRRAACAVRHGRRVPRRPSLGGRGPTLANSGDHDQRRAGNRPAGQHRDRAGRAGAVEEGGGPQQRRASAPCGNH